MSPPREILNQEDGWSTQTEEIPPSERASKRRRTNATKKPMNQEIGLMRDGGEPGRPRFLGSGSGIYFVRTVYDILARSSGQPPGAAARAHSQLQVPGEDDQLDGGPNSTAGDASSPGTNSQSLFWLPAEVAVGQGSESPSITFDNLVGWTRSYFEFWHPAFPFLHGPETLLLFERVANNGIESISDQDSAILRAMISLSLADARQLPRSRAQDSRQAVPVPSNLVFLSLEHVASCALFVLGTPASLRNIQAALCIELFLVSMLKFNMASRLGGVVVRMAYHLGLHRCPLRYTNFSAHEILMRKRIWWSFYSIERLVCQALGLPLDVQDDDVDVCFPTTESHSQTADHDALCVDGLEGHKQLQLLTLLAKHAMIRGMILELRHKSVQVRQDSMERAMYVQSKLTEWANEVHEVAMIGSADDEEEVRGGDWAAKERSISPFYKTLLLILQHESTIALNRPLLAQSPDSPASKAAIQACIQSSRAIIEIVDSQRYPAHTAIEANEASHSYLAAWPLLTWSVWMSCFILTYAALEGVTSISSAQRYSKRAHQILRQLSKRGTLWPEYCAQAVEHVSAALERRKSAPQESQRGDKSAPSTPTQNTAESMRPSSEHRAQSVLTKNQSYRKRRATPASARTITSSHKADNTTTPRTGQHAGLSHGDSVPRGVDSTVFSGRMSQASQPAEVTTIPEEFYSSTVPDFAFTPQTGGFSVEMDQQDWLFDPLSALDFSNFAQAGSAESSMGFNFY